MFSLSCALAVPSVARAEDPFATEVSSGDYHNCMVTSCGAVECWGRNDYGQSAGRGAPLPWSPFPGQPYESVSVGQFHSCALDAAGQIDCWGRANYGQTSAPAGTFVQLDTGFNHACAIDTDGHLACWGADDQGQSSPPAGTFSQVSAGRLHSCAITDPPSGQLPEVVCWGSDSHGQSHGHLPIDNADLFWSSTGEEFVEVVAGGYHTCGRTDAWQTYCWGLDAYGATGQALGFAPLQTDPSLWHWPVIQPVDLAVGTWGSCMVWRPSGNPQNGDELVCWGWPFETSYPAPDVVPDQVSVGSGHACYIGSDDLVHCFGNNTHGKIDVPEVNTCPGVLDPFPPVTWPW